MSKTKLKNMISMCKVILRKNPIIFLVVSCLDTQFSKSKI